jgi:hypothetical protein
MKIESLRPIHKYVSINSILCTFHVEDDNLTFHFFIKQKQKEKEKKEKSWAFNNVGTTISNTLFPHYYT